MCRKPPHGQGTNVSSWKIPTAAPPGVIHFRDTLLEPQDRPVQDLTRPAFILDTHVPVYEALAQIRAAGEQLATVMHHGRFVGVITLSDVLRWVLPR